LLYRTHSMMWKMIDSDGCIRDFSLGRHSYRPQAKKSQVHRSESIILHTTVFYLVSVRSYSLLKNRSPIGTLINFATALGAFSVFHSGDEKRSLDLLLAQVFATEQMSPN
jgi:hypothetical protein